MDYHSGPGEVDNSYVFGAPGDQIAAGDFNGDGLTDLAVFNNGLWFISTDRTGFAQKEVSFGGSGEVPLIGDITGNGVSDLILYQPSTGEWIADNGGNGVVQYESIFGGTPGDIPVVGDFTGDGRLDRAVFNAGTWYVNDGFNGTGVSFTFHFGEAGDVPFVIDATGSGVDDLGVYRNGVFYITTNNQSGSANIIYSLGNPGDVPIPGYYNAAAVIHGPQPNLAIFRPSTALISEQYTLNGVANQTRIYGDPGDQIVTGDFNGDTITQNAIFRNGTWFIDTNGNSIPTDVFVFGAPGDIALSGDVTGNGISDPVVFYNGLWFVTTNFTGYANTSIWSSPVFGEPGDIPVMGDFTGDGIDDRAVFRDGTWYIDTTGDGVASEVVHFGQAGDIPFAFDFNNSGKDDLGVYRNGVWYIDTDMSSNASIIYNYGEPGDIPIPGFYNSSNSIFVAPGGSGNGTKGSPLGSIQAAINIAASGDMIRIAPGNYNESDLVQNASNLTFIGASRYYTNIIPSTNSNGFGGAFSAYDSASIYLFDLDFASQDTRSGDGRGIAVYGSTVFADDIRTDDNMQEGVYTYGYGGLSVFDAYNSNFDMSKAGAGIYSAGSSQIQLTDCSASYNGSDESAAADSQAGRGIVVVDDTALTALNLTADYDADHGIIGGGGTLSTGAVAAPNILLVDSNFNFNANSNGGIMNGTVNIETTGCSFSFNGDSKARGPYGFNGLELDLNNQGSAQILNSIFQGNTAYGVFLGSGTNVVFSGDTFTNCYVGLYINGVNQGAAVVGTSSAIVESNIFNRGSGATEDQGIIAVSGGASATVGGSGSLANTFENYNSPFCTDEATGPNGGSIGTLAGGDGLSMDDANIYLNCIAPYNQVNT